MLGLIYADFLVLKHLQNHHTFFFLNRLIGLLAGGWGRYDHTAGDVRLDETSLVDNDDLINRLAVQTLRGGGTVYTLRDDDETDTQEVAAAFRFAAVEPPAKVQNRS